LLTEPTRASIGLARLKRGQTLGRIQRVSECDLQIELLLLARGAVGQASEDVQALPELCHRLGHRPPCDGLLAGLEAVTDGLLDEARFLAMLRQSLGLHLYDLRKFLFQGSSDTAMQLLPPVTQQGAVRGILHQRVLEGVFRIGGSPAPKNQFGVQELRQGVVQLRLRQGRNGADQRV
jgi:hypothetical protein